MMWSDIDIFEEAFYHDLESWFSADIACCDSCHDDYINTWPHAYKADKSEFQKSGIPLECFYSGSRLRESYSETEFDRLVSEIPCPRCGEGLSGFIWPFNLPFDVPNDFESTIHAVYEVAHRTPFLLLKNNFCSEIDAAITDISTTVVENTLNNPVFRGRVINSEEVSNDISNFDFPPPAIVSEGRYNHSGYPALYLASDFETCVSELRNAKSKIAEFRFTAPLRILDLANAYESHEKHSDLLNSLVYSALVSAKHSGEGQYKPHYVVSRFTADCARAAGFDAIKYPSTRRGEGGFNLVVLNHSLRAVKWAAEIKFHTYDSNNA